MQSKWHVKRHIRIQGSTHQSMFNKDDLNKLYQYALSLTRHEEIAYDILQSALEKYLIKLPRVVDKPLAYMKTIIRNLFFDLERRNKVIPMISANSEEAELIETLDDSSIEDVLMNQQEVALLTENLTLEENELLYLWAVEEHTTEEIAKFYQQPKGTILSKLHRLKKRIRNHAHVINVAAR